MRILLDECIAADFATELERVGFDVTSAREVCPSRPDDAVLALSVSEGRVLLTNDYDFGDLVVRLRKPCVGVVIVRSFDLDDNSTFARLAHRLWDMAATFADHLTIVEASKTRQRRLLALDE